MKKLLIGTNLLMLGIIFFLACNQNNKSGNTTAPEDSGKFAVANDSCKINCVYDAGAQWTGKVDWEIANELHNRYRKDYGKNRVWNSTIRSETEDTRCIWFPLATLKKFLWSIESNACQNGCSDSLGVHIYFAKYPDANAFFWKDPEIWTTDQMDDNFQYANQHTLFMVPTYYSGNPDEHIDFNPFSKGCQPLDPKDSISPYPNKLILLAGSAQNHGSLIPPKPSRGMAF
jgi:hypothetical protein